MKKIIFLILTVTVSMRLLEASEDFLGDLGTIVVTPTRAETAAAYVPANIKVITCEEIEKTGEKDIPSILEKESGIIISHPSRVKADVMGYGDTSESTLLVMVDGRRMDSPDMGGTKWDQITVDQIEKIEIVQGPASVLYGDNASAGVINIITRKPQSSSAGKIAAWASSYSGSGVRAAVENTVENISFILNGYTADGDGYRDNSSLKIRNAAGSVIYKPGKTSITFNGGYNYGKFGMPGDLLQTDLENGYDRTDTTTPDDGVRQKDIYFQALLSKPLYEHLNFKLDVCYQQLKEESEYLSFFSLGKKGKYRTSATMKIVREKNTFGIASKTLVGLDWDMDYLNDRWYSSLSKDLTIKNKIQFISLAPFIHQEIYPVKNVALSAGYRHNKANYSFDAFSIYSGEGDDTYERKETAFEAGMSWLFSNRGKVYARAGRSFRFPKTDEFFSIGSGINEDLEVQKSFDLQSGISVYFSKSADLDLNYTVSFVDNEIYCDPSDWSNKNYKETLHSVFELNAGFNVSENLLLKAGVSLFKAEFAEGSYEGNKIPGVPEYKAAAGLSFLPFSKLTLTFNSVFTGEKYFINDFANEKSKLDGYIRNDVGIKYNLNDSFILIKAENIFNEKYCDYGALSPASIRGYYPSAERNLSVEAGFRY